jgi:hypothetical protein
MESPAAADGIVPTYTSNTVLRVPMRNAGDDSELLRQVGRAVVDAVISGNRLSGARRVQHITAQLKTIPSRLAERETLTAQAGNGT